MITLSCEINKVQVTVILDSGANCNIIGESIAKIVGLKIDNTSNTEIYTISKFNILGIICAIEISILSQDGKQEQVEVTDIFVTNKPELESVLVLGQPWFQENVMKVDFPNKTLTLLDGTDILFVIGTEIPAPMQGDQSVDDYFKMIKIYAIALSIDLDNQDLKGTFFNGLSRDNKKEVIRFGFKKHLNEIVNHLNRISTGPTDIQKFRFGELEQGNESVMEYFAKVEKCGKLAGYNEERLRYFFLRGLSPDNQMEARRCRTDLSLDELVAKYIIYDLRMVQLNIFDLPELLEQILYFLEIDRSLYSALFVNRLWYHCSAPILWRRVEFFNEDYQQDQCEKNISGPLYW
ncbi:9075_t:CDS:2 [Acaulospora morrowiae]|uniref:9075_t:CDS:1 n=1 Tax=Acaulospora morrowiae TaxID=94023 RepID=A0A9N9HUG2_9GLOM|nr:9075_t:CDS:2 [Acaulospora morrowiae]